jgi:hypothetical protein
VEPKVEAETATVPFVGFKSAPQSTIVQVVAAPFTHAYPVWQALWFCQVPPGRHSWGTPERLHWVAPGVQSLQPPALNTQVLAQVCGPGASHSPLLQVPAAW